MPINLPAAEIPAVRLVANNATLPVDTDSAAVVSQEPVVVEKPPIIVPAPVDESPKELPEEEQVVLALDSSLLIDLKALRKAKKSGHDIDEQKSFKRGRPRWWDVLKGIEELPNIKALVVPSIIADLEMMGQIRKPHGQGFRTVPIKTADNEYKVYSIMRCEIAKEFFKDASRGWLDRDGNPHYEWGANRKLIIWDTQDDQRVYSRIAKIQDSRMSREEKRDAIQSLSYEQFLESDGNGNTFSIRGPLKDAGERAIDQFLQETPWVCPVITLCRDEHFLRADSSFKHSGRKLFHTHHGLPAGDVNTQSFLRSMVNHYAPELKTQLDETEDVTYEHILREIMAYSNVNDRAEYKPDHELSSTGDIDPTKVTYTGGLETFDDVIQRGVALKKRNEGGNNIIVPPAPIFLFSPQALPTSHSYPMAVPGFAENRLGELIGSYMMKQKLTFDAVADAMNAKNSNVLPIDAATVERIMRGELQPNEHLWALIELLVIHNKDIPDDKKESAVDQLLKIEHIADIAQKSGAGLNTPARHIFGDYVFKFADRIHLSDPAKFAQAVNHCHNRHLGVDPQEVTTQTVFSTVFGKKDKPSPGWVNLVSQALREKEPTSEIYTKFVREYYAPGRQAAADTAAKFSKR